jgi:competence protein ComEC
MKVKSIVALLLSALMLFSLFSCSKISDDPNDSTTSEASTVKMKFFKAGRSSGVVIRTEEGTIMIDTASSDQTDDILTYLAEKNISTIDYLILTNYSKKHIGGAPAILTSSSVSVSNVIVPSYAKASNTYTNLTNAMGAAGKVATVVSENSSFTVGSVTVNLYAPHKDYSTTDDENDEENSLAVSITYGGHSVLYTSRVNGERISELVTDLAGATFDLITVPNYGIYDSNDTALFEATGATSAIAFCSNNTEKKQMESATITALTNAGIKVYATRDGSVEVHLDTTGVTINGTPIN